MQSSFSDGKFILSQLNFFMKGLIFVALGASFFNLYDLTRLLQRIKSIFLSFLLIEFIVVLLFFIQSGEPIYGPPQFGFIL